MDKDQLRNVDLWWRAANYLAVGQIYLMDNPLLRRPLEDRDMIAPDPPSSRPRTRSYSRSGMGGVPPAPGVRRRTR